jgi:eukaryotic-like serine/threonine-protein kinase
MTLFFIVVMLGAAYFIFTNAVQGGELISVPDITGKSITEASNILTQAGLELGSQNQVVNKKVPEYHVIVQRPTPNTVVRQGRKVNLTVSQGRAEVKTPNFIGKTLQEAFTGIEEARFSNGSVARIPDSSAPDTVLAQDPAPSHGINVGTEIHLLVSGGVKKDIMLMPDLVGMPLAKVKLTLASMKVQVVPYIVDNPGQAYEIVLNQYPEPGTTLSPNQEVNFDVRLRPTSDLANARRKATINYIIPRTTKFTTEVRVDTIDESGNRVVIYPRITDYVDNRPPRFQPGQTFTLTDLAYTNELTVEFYANRTLHQTYDFSSGNDPIITTNQQTAPLQDTTIESIDLPSL